LAVFRQIDLGPPGQLIAVEGQDQRLPASGRLGSAASEQPSRLQKAPSLAIVTETKYVSLFTLFAIGVFVNTKKKLVRRRKPKG
jgi:hypothetical protein